MSASIILALHFMDIIAQADAVKLLYIAGVILLISELAVVSMGLFAFNGLLAIYAAYSLQTGQMLLLGIPMDWNIVFGISAIEFILLFAGIYVWRKLKSQRTETGAEGMIGKTARVVRWSGASGIVNFEGENWKAEAERDMELRPDDKLTIAAVKNMTLRVIP